MDSNQLLIESGSVAAALNMTAVEIKNKSGYGIFVATTVTTPAIKTFVSGTAEISTVTTIADTGVLEVQTVTFQTKAASTAGDYVVIEDSLGIKYAVAVNKTGTDAAPTGAIWAAIPSDFKKQCNISAETSAVNVAAAFELSFNEIRGFTTAITTNDTAADGTMTFTQVRMANVSPVVVKNATDAGAGGIAKAETTAGVASNLQNTYFSMYAPDGNIQNVFWYNVNSQGVAPVVTGAVINEIAIAKSASADSIASSTNTIVDALAAFVSTVSTNVVTVTGVNKYNLTNLSDTGLTGFAFAVTTPGVDNAFSIADNTITIAAHGYATGLKVAATTSAASFPTGLSTTDFWVIKVSATLIKLATSASNALAGTAVDITSDGSGTHTLTPAALTGGSYKLQASMDDVTYFDLAVTNNVTVTANFIHEKIDPMFNYVRVVWAVTTGQITYVINTFAKGY